MGIVYYANYFVWFEVARAELLRSLGWSYSDMESGGLALPVVEARCEYRRPTRYDDEVEVKTEGMLKSPVRLAFQYEVVRCHDGAVSALGHTVHAATDPAGRPCRLPERILDAFA
jgi:acyl-CoA thioester hydrolase